MTTKLAFVSFFCLFACALAATVSYKPEQRVNPFLTTPLPNYAVLTGATVSIEYGYEPGFDKLFVDYRGQYRIQGSFNAQNGVLYLSGTAPVSEYMSAITSVVFVTSADDGATRRLTWALGENNMFMWSTSHYYQTFTGPITNVFKAMDDCAARKFMGMQGYLATITSEAELDDVGSKLLQRVWVAAQLDNDNTWRWKNGPEAGSAFWAGQTIYQGGAPTVGGFARWFRFQPNEPNTGNISVALVPGTYQGVAYMDDFPLSEGINGYLCEFGGLDSAAVETTIPNYMGSTLLVHDCSLYSTSSECSNHQVFGCAWSLNTCIQTTCRRFLAQNDCEDDPKCEWNTDGQIGVCTTTRCSKYGDAATCANDPTCAVDPLRGASSCVESSCSAKSSSAACGAMSGCVWKKRRCMTAVATGCDRMDVIYLLDGSATMGERFEEYSTGFFGLAQELLRTDQALTGTSAGMEPTTDFGQRVGIVQYGPRVQVTSADDGSAGRLTGNRQQLVEDIQWHQAHFVSGKTGRKINDAILQAKNMFSPSSRKRVLVIVAAGEISDVSTVSVSAAFASLNANIIGIALRRFPLETANSTAAVKSLSQLTRFVLNATVGNFRTIATYGLCGNDPLTAGAMLQSAPPSWLCTHKSKINCSKDDLCAWDVGSDSCQNSGCISAFRTQSACIIDPSCNWDSDNFVCSEKCPGLSEDLCRGAIGSCLWNTNQAFCDSAPCVANPTEDSCIADSHEGCQFNNKKMPLCQAPSPKCVTTNRTVCITTSGCTLIEGVCYEDLCSEIPLKVQCEQMSQCVWSAANGTCGLNFCGTYVDEKSCSQYRSCLWNISQAPAACSPAPCRRYNNYAPTAQSNCAEHSECYWEPKSENGLTDQCVVKTCEKLTTSADCATLEGCIWRNNTCKDSTYVQCPAIDVVFLIETTPVTKMAFGRHPDGFIGMVESIREWSRAAPFSPNISNSGFRQAILGYGAMNKAMKTTTQGMTNTVKAWCDSDGELDQFEASRATYLPGQEIGEAGLVPGLMAARDLLKIIQQEAPDRKRLLIVMGTSPITDGAKDAMTTVVAELDAMNVQIFSNVIRRFSETTVTDLQASEYLRPLASDPHQQHFLFTTIDGMTTALLETFCDPTTGSGEALKINRDGTLPCLWFENEVECDLQPTCVWNDTAVRSCPQKDQCPNLGCVALPNSLSHFSCENCDLVSGQFQCSLGKSRAAVPGVCGNSPCLFKPEDQCTGSCIWNSESARCEKNNCTSSTQDLCNARLGCVWTQSGCRNSRCWSMRTAATCSVRETKLNAGIVEVCKWQAEMSPAVCVESRCVNLGVGSCSGPCNWVGATCEDKTCVFSSSDVCQTQPNCYWNEWSSPSCKPSTPNCELSPFSQWTDCSSSCGSSAIRFMARTILQPATGGASCKDQAKTMCIDDRASCPPSWEKMVVSQNCNSSTIPGWNSDCVMYCASLNSVLCTMDVSCEWRDGQCAAKTEIGCETLDQSACNAAEICSWNSDFEFCQETITVCQTTDPTLCNQLSKCQWINGNIAKEATQYDLPAQLVYPTQPAVVLFPLLSIESSSFVDGATVSITSNYQRGKDLLQVNYPSSVTAKWFSQLGTLKFSGQAPVSEYSKLIRAVTFFTSSTNTNPRRITWSLGNNTVYTVVTKHHYRHFSRPGVSWDTALSACAQSTLFGLQGYLATITSDEENAIVATKLASEGWISGEDIGANLWKLSSGPANERGVIFWIGSSVAEGGSVAYGQYANWDQLSSQPGKETGFSHPYLNLTGYWMAKPGDTNMASGYICEYGGMKNDQPNSFPCGGAMVMSAGGCIPTTCIWHTDEVSCKMDGECQWNGQKCVQGCSSISSAVECLAASQCRWDTQVLPPVCDINKCLNLGEEVCDTTPECIWHNITLCQYKSGCQRFLSQDACEVGRCQWNTVENKCGEATCNHYTSQPKCEGFDHCEWSGDMCRSLRCKASEQSKCEEDRKCSWSKSDISEVGFPPGGATITLFANGVQGPSDVTTIVDGITVAIIEGFQPNQDVLKVSDAETDAKDYLATFDPARGILLIKALVPKKTLEVFKFMQKNVQFSSSSTNLVRRKIVYSLSLNTFFTGSVTQTFLKYYSKPQTTFANASTFCEANTFFGVPGQLANIMNQSDNIRLTSIGAQGWIGAKSLAASSEWFWITSASQTAGITFWEGLGALGKPVDNRYAQWGAGEPLSAQQPQYAWLSSVGTWRSVQDFQAPRGGGVICQYNSNAIKDIVAGSRTVKPQGCFERPCVSLLQSQCMLNPQCEWAGDYCQEDEWCASARFVSDCKMNQLCYWDYNLGQCRSALPNSCTNKQTQQQCVAAGSACAWDATLLSKSGNGPGSCVFAGCKGNPTADSCTADPLCRWDQPLGSRVGVCVSRLCGYLKSDQCWGDKMCAWNGITSSCEASQCLSKSSAECSQDPECEMVNSDGGSICAFKRCNAATESTCLLDLGCIYTGGKCSLPLCAGLEKDDCIKNPQCYYWFDPKGCNAAQCLSYSTEALCKSKKSCRWDVDHCRQETYLEFAAGEDTECQVEVTPNLTLMWILLGIIVALLGGLIHRLYLAYAHGMNFFDPLRKNVKYSPHQQYAADLFEEAQNTGVERNVGYKNPTLQDL